MKDRVVHAARDRGIELDVCHLEGSPRTPDDVATALGCSCSEMVRSVVFVADGEPVLCMIGELDQIDPGLVCDALDCAEARPASSDEARAATGFPAGCVPPLAHDVRLVVDAAVAERPLVYAAGGDGRTRVAVRPVELLASVDSLVAPIAA
ncbi:MAG: hypothetical protein H0U42_09630 [Thermoleophilaceae bacterium]|nr:hypothetical protein [Thermoleophilaceae bacterium]